MRYADFRILKSTSVLQVAKRLLEKEILDRTDMVELLGPRPFQENGSYEELCEALEYEEETPQPEGLKCGEDEKQNKSPFHMLH